VAREAYRPGRATEGTAWRGKPIACAARQVTRRNGFAARGGGESRPALLTRRAAAARRGRRLVPDALVRDNLPKFTE
jgi:hypothetical protein